MTQEQTQRARLRQVCLGGSLPALRGRGRGNALRGVKLSIIASVQTLW